MFNFDISILKLKGGYRYLYKSIRLIVGCIMLLFIMLLMLIIFFKDNLVDIIEAF
jgi:hypothetical protein